MSGKGTFERVQQRVALLTCCGEIAADAAEGGGSCLGAEAPADLLRQFHHPDVALRAVVVERHPQVRHEA